MRCYQGLFVVPVLLSVLVAQVPTDSIVVLQSERFGFPFGTIVVTSSTFVDPFGGGRSPENDLGPIASALAVDPTSATGFFLLVPEGSAAPGVQNVAVGPLGAAPTFVGQPWTHPGGSRIRVTDTEIVTLRSGGIVERTPKSGGVPTLATQVSDAVDIAIFGPFLYVATADRFDPAAPLPLVEVDLVTGSQRVVGNYADVQRLAVSPTGTRLALGTSSGIVEVEATTGNVVSSAAVGPVTAVSYARNGSLVYAAGLWGSNLWIADRVDPIYSTAATILDVDRAVVATPSVVPFTANGVGCGTGAVVQWTASGLPQLGNTGFQFGFDMAPANVPAALFLGDSRSFSSVVGAPLPLDLSALIGGCSLLVDPIVPLVVAVDGAGSAVLSLPIPGTPSLAGAEWVGQAFVFDAGMAPLPFAVTSGIALRLEP